LAEPDQARRTLPETDAQVETIAVECGFGSPRRMDRGDTFRISFPLQTNRRISMSGFNIGFVIFPNLTQLDFTGPPQVLNRLPASTTHIVAKSLDPVPSDCGLSLVPTTTFQDCPQLDLICVPGGFGVVNAMADRETIDFVRRQAEGARFITSVCTGAFILGAAGLLKGRRATTHWAYTDLLSAMGATFEKARVVWDGNVITAGGVTSGIDFALRIVARIAGDDVAQAIQLGIEYDPAPPFTSGNPDRASDAVKASVAPRYARSREAYIAALAT
jgi:cyclohexyl-isocyanide hydratase